MKGFMNFVKNYLLLVLMGGGFLFIIIAFTMTAKPVDPATIAMQEKLDAGQPLDPSETAIPGAGTTEGTEQVGDTLKIEKMDGGTAQFTVELALTPEEQMRGLMERTELAADRGMLFVFPDAQFRSFWMKDTLIPLDIIFIEEDGTIHHIHPQATPHDTTGILSNGEVKYVLEIAGGTAEKLGIEIGDKVLHAAIH